MAPGPGRRGGRWVLGAALLLASFNLRPAIASLGPVLPEVMRSTGIGAAAASVLTTLPALCFGLFAPLAPRLSRRFGIERTVLGMVLLLSAGTLIRWAETPTALFAGAILAGAAIGVVNVLLPALVKRDFPDRVALMTGLYTMVLSIGAALAAGASAPLTLAFGSWGAALAIWAAPALLAGLALIPALPATFIPVANRKLPGLWRNGLAWQVTLLMGMQSTTTYCAFGWLALILRDRGMAAVTAGLVLSGSVLVQVGSSLGGAPFAALWPDQRAPAILSLAAGLAGFLGCLYLPLPWVWGAAALMGVGQGAVFSMTLSIIVLRSPDAGTAAQLSGMAQAVGYMLASFGPLLLGLAHQWTGDWSAAGPLLIAYTAVGMAGAAGAGRKRLVRPATL
ncbi:MAG: MFS transporter [Acetobacteraceae bacterium]|nr:MFS transporter [Acetobacteraceae bacterium]